MKNKEGCMLSMTVVLYHSTMTVCRISDVKWIGKLIELKIISLNILNGT